MNVKLLAILFLISFFIEDSYHTNYPKRDYSLRVQVKAIPTIPINNLKLLDNLYKHELSAKVVAYYNGKWEGHGFTPNIELGNHLDGSIPTNSFISRGIFVGSLENNETLLEKVFKRANEGGNVIKLEDNYDDLGELENEDASYLLLEFRINKQTSPIGKIRFAVRNEDGYLKVRFAPHSNGESPDVGTCSADSFNGIANCSTNNSSSFDLKNGKAHIYIKCDEDEDCGKYNAAYYELIIEVLSS